MALKYQQSNGASAPRAITNANYNDNDMSIHWWGGISSFWTLDIYDLLMLYVRQTQKKQKEMVYMWCYSVEKVLNIKLSEDIESQSLSVSIVHQMIVMTSSIRVRTTVKTIHLSFLVLKTVLTCAVW